MFDPLGQVSRGSFLRLPVRPPLLDALPSYFGGAVHTGVITEVISLITLPENFLSTLVVLLP
jgi:hypothetical protein